MLAEVLRPVILVIFNVQAAHCSIALGVQDSPHFNYIVYTRQECKVEREITTQEKPLGPC